MSKQIELVVWNDASASCKSWCDREAAIENRLDLLEVRSIGYVVKETDELIALAQNWAANDDISDVMVIPKGMVVKRRKL